MQQVSIPEVRDSVLAVNLKAKVSISFEGKKGQDTQSRGELGPVATGHAWQWGESVVWDPRKGEGTGVSGTGGLMDWPCKSPRPKSLPHSTERTSPFRPK